MGCTLPYDRKGVAESGGICFGNNLYRHVRFGGDMPRLLYIYRMGVVETVVNLCAGYLDRRSSFRSFFRERYGWRGRFKQLERGPHICCTIKIRNSHSNKSSTSTAVIHQDLLLAGKFITHTDTRCAVCLLLKQKLSHLRISPRCFEWLQFV